ncbi:hypothetical protein [Mycolicibacterium holsaticum]|jgi:hypothetical protein|uniref:hypothetical protein n=1 Tax=Mycolicibacterium holsaticum TaxID=152142 RepID=UPI0013F4D6EE|nr:hypothetical protein [Mycolicibacterium holsaticum]NLG55215.1 hypothetical protein [Rhodococcus sp. (in: high G+C Gram-positive bacteria)]QZA12052.1 hypothetical protein K3U96_23340 [Mycolicibacterium holsaticum DSM 44478 = JCM 12374]UNC10463.1 hypothetical protein H5U41_03475 [Mycolicibacterium holsaticum DSM 44478 = JCM 12374]
MSTTTMLPIQAAPIDRTPSGAAAFADQTGVDASGFWDVLGDVGKAAGSAALSSLAGMI